MQHIPNDQVYTIIMLRQILGNQVYAIREVDIWHQALNKKLDWSQLWLLYSWMHYRKFPFLSTLCRLLLLFPCNLCFIIIFPQHRSVHLIVTSIFWKYKISDVYFPQINWKILFYDFQHLSVSYNIIVKSIPLILIKKNSRQIIFCENKINSL